MHSPRFLRLAAAVAALALSACTDGPTAPVAPTPPAATTDLLFFNGPTYLACPTDQTLSTTGVIGPLGGLLSLGDYEVNIPLGAVPLPTLFQITVPAGRLMKVDVTAVGVQHYVFDAPVTVTVDYSRCPTWKTDGKDLEVWWVAPLLNLPLRNMGGTNDAANRKITFSTDHFSGYVIAY